MDSENFMLKEYDAICELFKIHYDYADKIIKNFLLVLGAFLTIVSYIYKDNFGRVDIFNFSNLALIALFITSITCSSLYLMLVEHRIKIIMYAKSANGIRKWAISQNPGIKPFLVLPDDITTPRYFSWFKGFFWEMFCFGLLNSIMMGISLIHIMKSIINIDNKYIIPVYISMVLALSIFHILAYKARGNKKIMTRKGHSVIDEKGVKRDPILTPSYHGKDCLGNGKHEGIPCCCDECDFYLQCFPDWKENMITK